MLLQLEFLEDNKIQPNNYQVFSFQYFRIRILQDMVYKLFIQDPDYKILEGKELVLWSLKGNRILHRIS